MFRNTLSIKYTSFCFQTHIWNGNLIQLLDPWNFEDKYQIVCYDLNDNLKDLGRLQPIVNGSPILITKEVIGSCGKAFFVGETTSSLICLIVSLPDCRILATVDLGEQLLKTHVPFVLKMYRNKGKYSRAYYCFKNQNVSLVLRCDNFKMEYVQLI